MEFKSQHAIYLQIADYICEKVLSSEWQADAKILSIRDLAIDVAVNPNTVVRSYEYLEAQGIIYKQRGIGYFVSQEARGKILALKKARFMHEELPGLVKTLRLLDINAGELNRMLEKAEVTITSLKTAKASEVVK